MSNFSLFIKSSINLDCRTLRFFPWSNKQKVEFLFKKYLELIKLKTGLKTFSLGKSSINLFGKSIYYDTSFAISTYQSMHGRLGKIIKDAKIEKINTVIDIGANVGFFTIMIKDIFPKSKIYAIEPVLQTYNCLVANTKSIKNVFPNQIAISNKSAKRFMQFNKNDSLISKFVSSKIEEGTEKVEVKTKSLDEFCEKEKIISVDFLKIDTETFELEVLQGAKKTLARTKYLLIEITIKDNDNYTFSELIKNLYGKNYNFQLTAFRNYSDKSEGPLPIGDFLFNNICIKK